MKICCTLIIAAVLISGGICASFLYNSSSQQGEIRQTATNLMRALDFKDYASHIQNWGDGQHVWGMRADFPAAPVNREIIWAAQFLKDSSDVIAKNMTNNQTEAKKEQPHLLTPLFPQDGYNSPHLLAALPHDYEDAIDSAGWPVRWRMPENLLAGYSLPRPVKHEVKKDIEPPARPPIKFSPSMNASSYRQLVENFASRYNMNVPLVMAIIHSESNFSPTLVSNKSAMGLMQLLPSTANDEVHRFLYGRRGAVGYEELRVPEINIRYGITYLHILLSRYFQDVRDKDVREACVIASYNMGPNRFLRLYGGNNNLAVQKINSMNNEEFYNDLFNRLPVRETRYFVEKVRRIKQHYSSLE